MSEKEPSFILDQTEFQRAERHALPSRELELLELRQDFEHYFSEEGKVIARRKFAGEQISGDEASLFDREKRAWWFSKYSFPYEQREERIELLTRKYMVSEDLVRRRDLQRALFTAVRENNKTRLKELRAAYIKEFPEQLEGMTVLFELPSYIDTQERIAFFHPRSKNEHQQKKDALERLTQYHFLVSHFVEQNSDDKGFLEEFWRTMEQLGIATGNLRQVRVMRGGVLSQVAAYKIFEQLGQHPQLSHPQQDAFDAIDMWSGDNIAVQIKTGRERSEELLIDTDDIAFPGVQTTSGDVVQHINTDLMRDVAKFTTKSGTYGKRIGKKIRGYYAVIPKQSYDHVTGEPSQEVVARFGKRLGLTTLSTTVGQ